MVGTMEEGIANRVRKQERAKHDRELQDQRDLYEEMLQDKKKQYEGIIQWQKDMMAVGVMRIMGLSDEDIARKMRIPVQRVAELFRNFQSFA